MVAAAEEAQICSLCSFGEHGQTIRGIDLKPIGGCQGRLGGCHGLYKKILFVLNRIGKFVKVGPKIKNFSLISGHK